MRSQIVFLLVIVLFGTGAQVFAQRQSEMNEEACKKVRKADAELNRDAQRAWIAFRDAHVRSIFPDPDWKTYGSVYRMSRCNVLEKITTDRAKELRHLWLYVCWAHSATPDQSRDCVFSAYSEAHRAQFGECAPLSIDCRLLSPAHG